MRRGATIRFATALAVPVAVAVLAAMPAWAGPGGGAAAARPAAAAAIGADGSGIVQLVLRRFVVVRELDASVVRVPVGPATVVFVNGARATLAQVKPGFVVQFKGPAGRPARVLRAVGPASASKAAGTVQSVANDSIVVTGADGTTVTILVDARTRVVLDGSPATLGDVRPGDLLVDKVGAAASRKPVPELRLRRPR
jgi:hypothetical protein